MSTQKTLRALRGATSVEANTVEAIESAAVELVRTMMERNEVGADDVVSLVFTATQDLNAAFPATPIRALGLDVPMLCAVEIPVPGSLQRCVRVLMHLYTGRDYASLRHVYLGEARSLRQDLPE